MHCTSYLVFICRNPADKRFNINANLLSQGHVDYIFCLNVKDSVPEIV